MTKSKTTRSAASQGDKRIFYVSLVIFLVSLALVIASVISRNQPAASVSSVPPATVAPLATLPANVVANLTALPQGQVIVLSGDLSAQIADLEEQVKNCPDYASERRTQMEQHFAWLRDSTTMPREVVIGVAANPVGRLILGMATFTSAEWGLHNRATDSCLLSIGRQLNTLLTQNGEQPLNEFAGG